MSYLVLARKWRPQSFDEIVGQEHVTRTLKNAITSDRVAHAYLFTGARGVGKTSAARILAKSLNCEKGPTGEPCNSCVFCKEITAGTAVDVHEIDGASNTSVDDVRELKESLNYFPSSCRKKVYIIDEVHMLSTSAFNALLKTLEEPPAHVVFIFATTEPHKIPGTILSRCQRFDFKRIPVSLIFARLSEIIKSEGVEVSEKGLMMLAREAEGGMRDAQSLLDQVISFSGTRVSDKDIIDVVGVIDRALVHEAGQAIIERQGDKCLKIIDRLFMYGWDAKEFGKELLEHFRNLAVVKIAPDDKELIDSTVDEIKSMKRLVSRVSAENLYLYFDVMSKGMEDVARSPHSKIALEMLLLKLASLQSLHSIDELIDLIERKGPSYNREARSSSERLNNKDGSLQVENFSGGKPPSNLEATPSLKEGSSTIFTGMSVESPTETYNAVPESSKTEKSWECFVDFIRKKNKPLGAILTHAHLKHFDEASIFIVPDNVFSYEKINDNESLSAIKAFSEEFFDKDIEFKVFSPSVKFEKVNSIHENQKKKESDRSRKLKKEAMEHPIVLESLTIFGGKIERVETNTAFND